MFKKPKTNPKKKGFNLIELVVVILVIAILVVAVFAGGSKVIKKSQISRTTSDLHNFSVAIESFLNEHPEVANCKEGATHTDFANFIMALNSNLPEEYKVKDVEASATTNITKATATGAAVYASAKTDAWDNPYYVMFDADDRISGKSGFYITVVSAGPDAKTELLGTIGADDLFLLGQYESGDVVASIYNVAEHPDAFQGDGSGEFAKYAGGDTAKAPVNFR